MLIRRLRVPLTGACLGLALAALPTGTKAQVVLEEQSNFGPALAFMNDNIYLGWTGRDSKINVMRSSDGIDFRAKIILEERTANPPTLASLNDRLFLAWTGRDGKINVMRSEDGGATWDTDHEVLLAGDGIRNIDLGYPSTVQLADGMIVTALYYASGSETGSEWGGWGDISCQAIRYREEQIR